jgi:hypothetical protein
MLFSENLEILLGIFPEIFDEFFHFVPVNQYCDNFCGR